MTWAQLIFQCNTYYHPQLLSEKTPVLNNIALKPYRTVLQVKYISFVRLSVQSINQFEKFWLENSILAISSSILILNFNNPSTIFALTSNVLWQVFYFESYSGSHSQVILDSVYV